MFDHSNWLDQLAPGNPVAYGNTRYGKPSFRFSAVKTISPSGKVITLESGEKFNRDGSERGKGYNGVWLYCPEEARQLIAVCEQETQLKFKRKELENKLLELLPELSLEQLDKLEGFVSGLQK